MKTATLRPGAQGLIRPAPRQLQPLRRRQAGARPGRSGVKPAMVLPDGIVLQEGYLPTKLYDLNSAYGDYKELRSLLRALQAQGIGAILDTVINHRCGDRQNENGKWVLFSDELGHDNKRLDWGPWALVSNHPDPDLAGTGAVDEYDNYHAAPNVDHTNPE
eukprot:scaffold376419_cov35-Prasinocladus_malaysianus.AAC.1